jgi:endo-1,4-beta-xylanase
MSTRTTRRAFLASAALASAAPLAAGDAQQKAPWEVPPLKEAFKGTFLIGTALNYLALQGKAPMDLGIATTHFSAITPDNSLKPDFTQREEGRFTFAEGDRLVEIAEQCGATPIGHVLVWHDQTPKWFFTGPGGQPPGRELALARMRAHIAAVAGHFKGRVKQWDVVNEALSDTPGEWLRPTPWLKAIGEDYIAEAFRAAHEADPSAILIYNDYNIELGYKRPKALRLLHSLLDQKVPIHAIGIQGHWRLDAPDFAEVEAAIKEFGALGLKVMITELDIGVLPTKYHGANLSVHETMTPGQKAVMDPYVAGLPDEVARQHAERFRQAFEVFLQHREVIGRVTLWGPHDGHSWLNNFPIRGRTDYPLLFDRQGRPKPAFYAVRQAALNHAGSTG